MSPKIDNPELNLARIKHKELAKKEGIDQAEVRISFKKLKTLENRILQQRRRAKFYSKGRVQFEIYLNADQQEYITPIAKVIQLSKSQLLNQMIYFAMENEELFFDRLNKDLPPDRRLNIQLDIEAQA